MYKVRGASGAAFRLLDVLEGMFQLKLQRIGLMIQTCEFLVCRLFLEEDFGIELRWVGQLTYRHESPSREV